MIAIGGPPEHTFSEPLGLLSDCHRRIELFLGRMIVAVDRFQGGPIPEAARGPIGVCLRYFAESAPLHTADEEESLFPRLVGSLDPAVVMALARLPALHADHREMAARRGLTVSCCCKRCPALLYGGPGVCYHAPMTDVQMPDPPLRVLMVETWAVLRANPGLWTPPLVLNLLVAMLATSGGRGASILVPMIGAWLLTIAFRAGWLEQMDRAVVNAGPQPDKEFRTTWSQFLEGVGHYFWRFLGGEIALLLLLGIGLVLVATFGSQSVGLPDQAMIDQVMNAARKAGGSLNSLPAATVAKMNAWTLLLLGWACYWGMLALGLLFWQTVSVWQNQNWPKAWLASLRLVGRHFRLALPLALLQVFSYLFVFQLMATGSGLLMMFGYAGYLLVWTFFTLMTFLVLKRWETHAAPTPENP
ncbi:MAG: hemerythrin domain-containing protein [Candidatus Sericytochromatia bacterium]|nr:hemerythrin domain-containing protein [Candidatus Sericytochromatia bacterium]